MNRSPIRRRLALAAACASVLLAALPAAAQDIKPRLIRFGMAWPRTATRAAR